LTGYLFEEVEEKLRNQQRQADRDLEIAATIQQTLIPRYSPRIGPIRFAWRFDPCERIGGDIFGKERLFRNLQHYAGSTVQTLMDRVQTSLKEFAGSADPNDDASIMVIEYIG